jgi:hypothetical protein
MEKVGKLGKKKKIVSRQGANTLGTGAQRKDEKK